MAETGYRQRRIDDIEKELASLSSQIHIKKEEIAFLNEEIARMSKKLMIKEVNAPVKVSEITEDMKERVRAEFKDLPRKLRDTTIFKDVKELSAGRYYIGDPNFFYFDDEELGEKMMYGLKPDNKNFNQFRTPKGDVLVYQTTDDGYYYGNDFVFPVDSASLSVVNANLGNEEKTRKEFKFQHHDPKPQVFFETFTKPLLVFYQEQRNSLIFISECKGSAWRMEIEDVRFIDERPLKKKKTQK